MKNWKDETKMEYDLMLHKELSRFYELVTKLVIVCLRKNIKLVIENPYSSQHYLHKYWAIKPKVIDEDRRENGDYYKKPTQYWFINCEPKNNLVMDYIRKQSKKKTISTTMNKVERSMIAPCYAEKFIKEYII